MGLKKCHEWSYKFPNFIRSSLLIRRIQSESIHSEFAQACLFLFSLFFSASEYPLELYSFAAPFGITG